MSKLIIYHKHCTDGLTAAAAVVERMVQEHHAYELFAATYGDPPPEVRARDVYIVDFSYPRTTLLTMANQARSLLVLDHHKTAAAELEGLDFAKFDMARSGAGMAWDHFHPNIPRPKIVDLVEDRDLWRWQYGEATKHFFAALDYDLNREPDDAAKIEVIRMLFGAGQPQIDQMFQDGVMLNLRFQQLVENMAEYTYPVELLGTPLNACNAPGVFASELGNYLVTLYDTPACIWYSDGEGLKVMLRSRDDLPDVSAIAKVFGGGGHRNAAGFYAGPTFFTEIGVYIPEPVEPEPGHTLEAVGLPGVKVWDVTDGDKLPGG